MTFANPYFLLLIIAAVIAVLISLILKKSAGSSIRFPVRNGFNPSATFYSRLADILPFFLRTAALFLLIIALARPQEINRTVLPPSQGVDIIIALDTSTSMRALDFDPYNRLQAAKKTAQDFIKKRHNDRIGIVVFAANAMLQCPLTLDYQSLLEFLDEVHIGMTHSDGTAIGDAIATATNHLKNSSAKSKVIILLTDGRSNTGVIPDPVLAAKAAESYGIRIYTIGTAGKGPVKIPVNHPLFGKQYVMQKQDLDEATLIKIAHTTNGEFFRATNYDELEKIYSKINALEKTEFKNSISVSYNDMYVLFLLPALILLLIELILGRVLFLRIP